jgi:hypothetical protein
MSTSDVFIFLPGDIVQLNELSNKRAKFRSRRGVVVGRSRVRGKFRILWHGLKRPQIVQGSLLQLAEGEQVETFNLREVAIASIEDELERIRQLRFAPHLNMPRPPLYPVLEPAGARIRWNWRVLDFVLGAIIGLTAASVTISQLQ